MSSIIRNVPLFGNLCAAWAKAITACAVVVARAVMLGVVPAVYSPFIYGSFDAKDRVQLPANKVITHCGERFSQRVSFMRIPTRVHSTVAHLRLSELWLILFSLDIMIIATHSIIYRADSDADRAFLRDMLKLTYVEVGGGWLIFGLPPTEVAVHRSKKNGISFIIH